MDIVEYLLLLLVWWESALGSGQQRTASPEHNERSAVFLAILLGAPSAATLVLLVLTLSRPTVRASANARPASRFVDWAACSRYWPSQSWR
jgi:hypothetical protein